MVKVGKHTTYWIPHEVATSNNDDFFHFNELNPKLSENIFQWSILNVGGQ